MKKYIDLHCHPFLEYFEQPQVIIQEAHELGVGQIFLVGTDLRNCQEVLDLAKQFEYTHAIIGIHPNDAYEVELVDKLAELFDETVVAIGEVGLDYHYENAPDPAKQKLIFQKQIDLAHKHNLPVMVHSRDAHEDTYQMIKAYKTKHPEQDFILHSYSSGPEYVAKYVALGVYFSFSGIVTFKNAKAMQEACKLVPLELLFCETDVPYLAPMPYRGQTNLPQYIIETTNFVAQLKNISIEKLLEQIWINAQKVFKKAHLPT